MRNFIAIFQVSFTFIGTIVGAGFASGQEILQFFTRYGSIAVFTILISTVLFILIGIKLMLLACDLQVKSYSELNRILLGSRIGQVVNYSTAIILLGTMSVMLAGAGTLLQEQLDWPYWISVFIVLLVVFVVLCAGIQAIMSVNSVVVPVMIGFCLMLAGLIDIQIVPQSWQSEHPSTSWLRMLSAPFLYAAFNLAMAQAILVPLSFQIKNRMVVFVGGLLGGVGIGLLLLLLHFVLSSQYEFIYDTEIPLASVMHRLAKTWQPLFVIVLFSEMLTTILANGYGLHLQVRQRFHLPKRMSLIVMLCLVYFISLIGFKDLLIVLYPLFGWISIGWLILIFLNRRTTWF